MNKIWQSVRSILGTQPIPISESASLRKIHIYKFHPVTGANADDIVCDTDERKQEIAEMFRQGARFYWHKPERMTAEVESPGALVEGYERIEYGNFEFVVRVMGKELIINDRP